MGQTEPGLTKEGTTSIVTESSRRADCVTQNFQNLPGAKLVLISFQLRDKCFTVKRNLVALLNDNGIVGFS